MFVVGVSVVFARPRCWHVRSVCKVLIMFGMVRSHTKEALKGIASCGGSLGDDVECVQQAAMKYVKRIKVPEVVVMPQKKL